jgi:3alpha(or 20beta)-hydroxysteroid dehydrogenase
MNGRFEDKVVVITGAAGGIGRATAIRFAAEGARVVAVDLAAAAGLAETVAAVEAAGSVALPSEADVSRLADVERTLRDAVDRFGGVDFLFNNAGIEGAICPLTEYPEDVFDRVMAVNCKGVWLGMKVYGPHLRERGGRAIVNTASTAGLSGTPSIIAYGASKHAVVGMTRTAALELAHYNIRVNAICPSPIETRMMRALERGRDPADPEAVHRQNAARNPLKRYGEPAEVAALVAFLCSPDASYINGAIYPIDGGTMAGR